MFKGVYTAIVTPFNKGKVDYDSLARLIDFNLGNGVDGIVPCGTTGEAPGLTEDEYAKVMQFTVEKVSGRGKVIAGAGANSTERTVENLKLVKEKGCDAAIVVTPYYNRPTQKGLKEHYEHIAGKVDIPIIVYNVPARTGVNLLPETLEEMCKVKKICGIKEASGSLTQIAEIRRRCPAPFSLLSGDDQLFLPTLAVGGDGIISVASNIMPKEISEIWRLFGKGEMEKARGLFLRVYPVMSALFLETNPIPIKAALDMMGKIRNELRLPLSTMSDDNVSKLKAAMKGAGLV